MTRNNSLLILGHGYTPPARFPQCDITWTTLATVNDDRNILNLPNLLVWDTGHDIENKYDVPFYNINSDAEKWLRYRQTHGNTFANQYCWMLADVAGDGSSVAAVTLFGVRMTDPEYVNELSYMAYHIGFLRARGVGITICQPSQLLRPRLYGMENEGDLLCPSGTFK
jgi:hypothetical protein